MKNKIIGQNKVKADYHLKEIIDKKNLYDYIKYFIKYKQKYSKILIN